LVTAFENTLLKERQGRIEAMGRQKKRCNQLLEDPKRMKGYWILRGETLDHTLWRTRFGRGCGSIIRQITE